LTQRSNGQELILTGLERTGELVPHGDIVIIWQMPSNAAVSRAHHKSNEAQGMGLVVEESDSARFVALRQGSNMNK
jgi:hypothetical protein